jgi:ribosomal subunit interface protein
MQIIISNRNVELAENVREHMEERFQRLAKFDGGVSRIEVSLREEKNRCAIEANLTVRGRAPIHAGAEAAEFRTSIDRLYEKLSRQLKKSRSRIRGHKGRPKDLVVATEETDS